MSTIRFIAGSGRSGTTWIQDALATANSLRPVFEPLHPYVSSIGERYAYRALRAEDAHPDLEAFLVRVSTRGGSRLWTQYRQQLRWLLPPVSRFSSRQDAARARRHWSKFLREFPRMTWDSLRRDSLVKCIRSNLMLPWLVQHLACRVVFVVRHPGAVVESELRSGWNASFALERFRRDRELEEITNGRYSRLLAQRLGPVQSLTLRWVIENQWVAESAARHAIPVFHYEQLRSSTSGEWSRLCAALNLRIVPDAGLLTRPSQQSGTRRTAVPIDQPEMPRWMRGLTGEHRAQVRSVLDAVELDMYSVSDPLPRHWAAPNAHAGGSGTAS